jgi:uncharacterized FlaG/YvyC family protein
MQVESFSPSVSFTPVSQAAPDLESKAAVSTGASLPASSSSSAEETRSFPQEAAAQPDKAAQQIQDAIQDTNISLNFSRDEESGAIVVKWVDQRSGEAIQQIPSETTLRLAAVLGKLQGQFFDQKA